MGNLLGGVVALFVLGFVLLSFKLPRPIIQVQPRKQPSEVEFQSSQNHDEGSRLSSTVVQPGHLLPSPASTSVPQLPNTPTYIPDLVPPLGSQGSRIARLETSPTDNDPGVPTSPQASQSIVSDRGIVRPHGASYQIDLRSQGSTIIINFT